MHKLALGTFCGRYECRPNFVVVAAILIGDNERWLRIGDAERSRMNNAPKQFFTEPCLSEEQNQTIDNEE